MRMSRCVKEYRAFTGIQQGFMVRAGEVGDLTLTEVCLLLSLVCRVAREQASGVVESEPDRSLR